MTAPRVKTAGTVPTTFERPPPSKAPQQGRPTKQTPSARPATVQQESLKVTQPESFKVDDSLRSGRLPQPPPLTMPPQFDFYDRAPEDRHTNMCHPQRDAVSDYFGRYDPVVRGSLHIEGVNYAKYEAQKHRPGHISAFLDALRDDLISEIGNGVRREDILLQMYPGAIKTVVLHYDRYDGDGPQSNDPKLVDAEWAVKCDYAIRARDVFRQQNIAMAIFCALSDDQMFSVHKMKRVYLDKFDPNSDVSKVRVMKPQECPDGCGPQQRMPPPPPQPERMLSSPPRSSQLMLSRPAPHCQPYSNMMCPPGTVPVDNSSVDNTQNVTIFDPRVHPQQPRSHTPMQNYGPPPARSQTPIITPSQPHIMVRNAITTPDGWTEYDGKRGMAVFIPEEALSVRQYSRYGAPYDEHTTTTTKSLYRTPIAP